MRRARPGLPPGALLQVRSKSLPGASDEASRRALGWAMLAITFVPAGDMVIVLSNDGSPGTAYGVHGFTAAAVAVTAGLLLRERPLPATTPGSAEPASHPAVGAGPGRAFGGLPRLRHGR
ncbi:DUF4267 domain-containing protein [Streptomyces sp. NPDC048479]|uniref:DUF4267 domain-containing protein n=1 Tax=Streptomyces sp. NPDC048479 TaxID=3154725 RepID=UPI003420E40A